MLYCLETVWEVFFMDLPKNIIQIGEVNHSCKIYVEDYVVSYLKQLNRIAVNKDMAAALYGIRQEEGEISYLFLYGACKLDFLQRETRHLSQAQQQEIEKLRRKYFENYTFLGYRLLNGEMIEGFHICEQGICRYIAGYAQFYEKNDSMLAYMLDVRDQEALPEVVDQEKYETVKRRQEARRAQAEEGKKTSETSTVEEKTTRNGLSEREREDLAEAWRQEGRSGKRESSGLRGMKMAAAAVFALLCVAGLSSLTDAERREEWQAAAGSVVKSVTEQKLPDDNTLIVQDKLTEAVQRENEASGQGDVSNQGQQSQTGSEQGAQENQGQSSQAGTEQGTQENSGQTSQTGSEQAGAESGQGTLSTPGTTPEPTQDPTPSDEPEDQEETDPTPYVIQQGDTLIGISLRNYGSKSKIEDICNLNGIKNPDDIKVGQKILLP